MNRLAQKMANAYREKLAEAGLARCKICGRYFRPNGHQRCCSYECSEENTRRNIRKHNQVYRETHGKHLPPTMRCTRCGKEVPNAPFKKYCKECAVEIHRERARAQSAEKRRLAKISRMPAVINPITEIEMPIMQEELPTCWPKPGGWTGPITKEPDRPVRARLRIPASKLPKPPFPPSKPLRINLEPPQTAYEYEVTPEAREARKPKKRVAMIRTGTKLT